MEISKCFARGRVLLSDCSHCAVPMTVPATFPAMVNFNLQEHCSRFEDFLWHKANRKYLCFDYLKMHCYWITICDCQLLIYFTNQLQRRRHVLILPLGVSRMHRNKSSEEENPCKRNNGSCVLSVVSHQGSRLQITSLLTLSWINE